MNLNILLYITLWTFNVDIPINNHSETFEYKNFLKSKRSDSTYYFVPDSKTAERIAEAIFEPIFGKKYTRRCKPFKATLLNDSTWIVNGSLRRNILLRYYIGGGPVALIQKKDGKIIDIYHTK
ncbi:MAG: NTF2 fold immunity protein [Bacteroidota bacterium]|nr:NTF2 fold immunity protein [Bacteroidota bacterium]